jgi:flavin reductase (DIM6/NTAB) family NADH-FMN oxidoreductase RutF
MSVGEADFREAMSRLPSAVTVVTVREGGELLGMTAGSVCSLSLEPPMLLVCVDQRARIHQQIISAPVFGIDVLNEGQRDLARRFADPDSHRFDGSPELSPAGLPLIAGSLLHLDCSRAEVYAGGDHSIVTGVVDWIRLDNGPPLTYFRRSYGGISP